MKTLQLLLSLWALSAFASRPNILFIGVDDLRPELGCYGSSIAETPNMDRLAADGMIFERAYCQQPICGPSRASLMTGMRPDTLGVTHNYLEFREQKPDVITMPQHLIANGYETAFCGKIFHGKHTDDAHSWSRKPAGIKIKKTHTPGGYALKENQQTFMKNRKSMMAKYGEQAKYGLGNGPAYECADVPDHTYEDGYNTLRAIATMKEMAKSDKPFFLGLGFKKPHLNWVAPKKYWDLYERKKIPLTKNGKAPVDGAAMGLHPSFELRVRHGIPKDGKPLDAELSRTLKHAYLACVSYVDAQIGLMINALEEAGVDDNTIIIIWGDHGWHLGDMGVWGKATNYEVATRVPLIIWTPRMPKKSRGVKSRALVELIDMFPTLCELAGVKKPAHLEGRSFTPLMINPELPWKSAAFSQFPTPALRGGGGSVALRPGMRETYFGPLIKKKEAQIAAEHKWDRKLFEEDVTGYAMRTERYRLIAWKDTKNMAAPPLCVELFDHESDPLETRNIAKNNPELVKRLLKQLDDGIL